MMTSSPLKPATQQSRLQDAVVIPQHRKVFDNHSPMSERSRSQAIQINYIVLPKRYAPFELGASIFLILNLAVAGPFMQLEFQYLILL